jgi:redox-sensitive bicupin YhaK (pirin superfamily)
MNMAGSDDPGTRARASTVGPGVVTGAAPLRIRRSEEIYFIDGGWFRSRWHFSFDQYYDEENMGIGTLRVFNDDVLVPGAVWPMHPHRNVEGITYVVEGEFEHADSLGNDGVLLPGGVQRMRLGRGAEHSERNHSNTEEMRFIQMWVLPAERDLQPAVAQRQYAAKDRLNRLLQILRPEGDAGDGITVAQDTRMFVSRLERGREAAHAFTSGRGGYVYLIAGEVDVNGERLELGDAAYVLGAGRLRIRSGEDATAELLLVDTPL